MNAREHRRQATRTSATAPAARWLLAIFSALGAAGGCGNSAPHGPPVLQQDYWETHGGVQTLVWSSIAADAGITNLVAPAATQFDLVFDRVIDGSKVEDTVTVNGVSHQQPKMVPPVKVSWPGMDPGSTDPGFYLSVWYNSVRLPPAPVNSSYVYGRQTASNPFAGSQAVATKPSSYPSNTTISICINPNGITSQYDEPMAALSLEMSSKCPVAADDPAASWPAVTVMTAPFAVAINPPPGAVPGADPGPPSATPTYVPTSFSIPLQFNNITVDPATQLSQYVQVKQNGMVLAPDRYSLQPSVSDPTLIFLQPGSSKIWDSGAQLDVTLSAALRDIYGATLGAARSASFIPCQLLGEDAGVRICAPPILRDGGAADDAGDGPVSADASADAPDAGADGSDAADDTASD
jgi:hypothetical protein